MNRQQYSSGGGGFGLTGPVPRDVWILLSIVFGTFSLQFFSGTAVLAEILRLSPAVWQRGFLWQLATYPFVGTGVPGFWFVVELLVLFIFSRQVLYLLGARRFWTVLAGVAAGAAVVAVVVQLAMTMAGSGASNAFVLMQGQRMVLAILIAVFATLNGHATVLLFFVLPIQARWFLLLEILFAFLGFLSSHDFAGFVGVCAAVGFTVMAVKPGGGVRALRDLGLKLETWWLRLRLAWLRRRRGFRIVTDERPGPKDPWVH